MSPSDLLFSKIILVVNKYLLKNVLVFTIASCKILQNAFLLTKIVMLKLLIIRTTVNKNLLKLYFTDFNLFQLTT